jgi:hypothetical protein
MSYADLQTYLVELLMKQLVLRPRALARGLFDPGALRRLADAHRTGEARGCRSSSRTWLRVGFA